MIREEAQAIGRQLQRFIDRGSAMSVHEDGPGIWRIKISSEDGQWISACLSGAFYMPTDEDSMEYREYHVPRIGGE